MSGCVSFAYASLGCVSYYGASSLMYTLAWTFSQHTELDNAKKLGHAAHSSMFHGALAFYFALYWTL